MQHTDGQRHPEADDGDAHGDGERVHALVLDEVDDGHVVVLGTDVVDHRRVAGGGNKSLIVRLPQI